MRKFFLALVMTTIFGMLPTMVNAQSCATVTNLGISAGTAAVYASWSSTGTTPDYYNVYVEDLQGTLVQTATVYEEHAMISGLDSNTTYIIRVQAECSGITGTAASQQFKTRSLPCAEIDTAAGVAGTFTVGTPGTGTTNVMPITEASNYSYVMHWVPRSALPSAMGASTITGVDFDYQYTQPMTHATNCTIYMGHTTTTTSSGGYIPLDSLTMVYEGPLNPSTQGWNHWDFNRGVFQYDGTRTIVISIVNNSGASNTSCVFGYESLSSISKRINGSTPYTEAAIRQLTTDGTTSNWRSNMRFTTGQCLRTADCAAPLLAYYNLTGQSVDLEWAPGWQESMWDVEYKPESSSSWTMLDQSTSATTYSLSNLTPNTRYSVRVTGYCTDTTMASTVTFETPCSEIPRTSLPYSYGFEDATASGSAGQISSCLKKGTSYTSTAYPYPSSSYSSNGTYSLYFYGTSSYYSYVALPPIENGVSDLMVTFDLMKTSTSYMDFEVGVMTDPTNYSTFTRVGTFNPSSTYTFETFTTTLSAYTGNGQHVAFRIPVGTQANYFYLDNITVDILPACSPVRNLTVENVSGASAIVSWGRISGLSAPASYELEIDEQGMNNPSTETDTINRHIFAGLNPFTTYDVRVRGVCDDGTYTSWETTTFTTGCLLGGDSGPSGTANNQTSGCPVYSSYGNTFCQSIYTVSQLRSMGLNAGNITGCSLSWSTNNNYNKRLSIYIDTTWRSSYPGTSSSYWHRIDTAHRNYSGPHPTGTTGTVNYTFTRPFHWDGGSNIVLTVIMNQDGTSQSSSSFYGISSPTADYTTMYTYRDQTAYDTNSVPSSVSSRLACVPNITFMMPCDSNATCAPPNVYVSNVSGTEATLAWAPGYQESGWSVEYRVAGTSQWIMEDSYHSTPDYTFTSLSPNTAYQARITPDCSIDPDSMSSIISFTTPCIERTLPFVETFEGWDNTNALPGCWHRLNNYTSSTYPYLSSSQHHGGTYSAYMYHYTSSSYYAGYVLPMFNVRSVDSLIVSFWMYKTNTTYNNNLQVGVMTDPTNFATFVPVATVTPTAAAVWEEMFVSLTSYTGEGRYIALLAPSGSTYNYVYIDDLYVDYAPACSRPEGLAVSNTTANSADATWTNDGTATDWVLEYGPQGFTLGTGTMVSASTNSTTLTGLGASTTYDLYLAAVCNYTDTSWYIHTTFQTQCGDITRNDMPWHYGFEDASSTGSTATIHRCTHKGTNYSTAFPYPSNTHNTGTYSLYFYSANGYYSYFTLPPVENTVTDLMVEFSTYMSGNYNGFEVGVMSDPNDYTTFTTIASATPSALSTWQQFAISLATYSGTGRYIAFRAPSSSSSYYFYLDDITISPLPACSSVRDAEMSDIHGTSARMSWSILNGFPQPSYYEIEIEEAGTSSATTETDTTTWHVFTMLNPETQYDARVRAVCDDGSYTDWATTTFTTSCLSGGWSNPSGTGTENQSGCPVVSSWGNTFSQTIFTASDLHAMNINAGNIGGCKITWISTGSYTKRLSIFLDTTSASNFPSNSVSYWKPIGTHNMVYSDIHQSTSVRGEIEYQFTNSFHWDGSSNVVMTIVMNQEGSSQSSSGFNAYSSNVRTGVTMYKYQDGTAWSLTSVPSSVSSVVSYRVNVSFMLPCDSTATCAAPYVYLGNISDSTATVHWAPGYQESMWDVDYRRHGTTTWTQAVAAHSSTDYTFTGLQPNTRYDVRVTPDCSIDPDSLTGTCTFLTQCSETPLPFTENFDTWNTSSSSSIPGCWFKLYSGTTAYPYGSTSYNHTLGASSGKSLYMYNTTSGGHTAIVLPVMDAPTDSLELTFWAYKTEGSSYGHAMMVGIIDDPEDFSTFTQVGPTLQCSQIASWEAFGVSFSSYAGSGRNIAIVSNYGYPYIDDISVLHAANCDWPTDCRTLSTTTTSATFSWNGHGVGDYVIEYGSRGFAHGQGTTLTTNDDSITVTGLTANTNYDFYVRAVCNGTDSSNWSVARPFTTDCDEISQLPYTYGFEDATTSGTGGHISHCWYKGTNNTSTPYPYPSTTSHTGSYSLYAYTTSSYYCYAVLPLFQANITDLKISFWYKRSGTSYPGIVQVGVMTDPADISTFTLVQSCTAAAGTNWDAAEVLFNNYSGTGRYIALRMPTNSTTGYVYVDDITVDSAGSCPPPTQLASTASSITTNSAEISWTENGNASQWTIEYGPRGFTLGQGTTVRTTANPTTLTGLASSTDYEFVVRSICSPADSSNFSAARGTFSTTCAPITHAQLPYTYGFEDATGTGSSVPINRCWGKGTNYTSTAYPYPSSTYIHTGTYSLYFYATATYYSYVVLPDFADHVSSLSVSFWARRSSASYSGKIVVGVLTDPTDINSLNIVDTITTPSTSWNQDSVNFGTYSGPNGNICFKVVGPSSANYVYMDDIRVYSSGTGCPTPMVTQATPTYNQVSLTWSGSGNRYQVAIKAASDGNWPTETPVTGRSHIFTNLTPSTMYEYRVRQDCDTAGTSSWAEGQVTTSSIPCMEPSHPTLNASTSSTATIRWTPGGYENQWVIHTFSSSTSHYDTVSTNPATVTGLTSGTAYQIAVAAVCSSTQTSGWSDTLSVTTQTCNTPTGLSATATGTSVSLSWTSPSTISAWEVEYGTQGFTQGNGTVTRVTSNPTTITGLNPTTAYDFYVRAECGTNFFSDWTSAAHATTGNPSGSDCNPVSNITTNVSGNSVGVSWTPGANNNGNWIVEYGPQGFSHGNGNTVNSTSTSTTVNNLTYGTTYDLYVRADCGNNNLSSWTGPQTFTISCLGITHLAAQVAGTTAFLTWDAVQGASFEIEYGPQGFSQGSGTTTTSTTNGATLSGLAANSNYTAYVRSVCGGSNYSAWASTDFTTGNSGVQVCDPVTDVSAMRSGNAAVVSWTAGANNTGVWEIEYGEQGFTHGNGTMVSDITMPIRQIDNLPTGVTYQFYVRAVCAADNVSPWSPAATLRIPDAGIQTVALSGVSFQIYPNPAPAETGATIAVTTGDEAQQIHIALIDIMGRELQAHDLVCEGNCKKQVSLSGLPSGTYFVRISTGSGSTVQRLVIR